MPAMEDRYGNIISGPAFKIGGREMKIAPTEDSVRRLSEAMGKPDHPFKSKPNWKEAFEHVLAGGGAWVGLRDCRFCRIVGYPRNDGKCDACPLKVWDGETWDGHCAEVFHDNVGDSDRRAICRHVLATVKDFTDRDEIRARIAEMLDDPEKFLGKAAVKCYVPGYDVESAEGYQYLTGGDKANPKPKLLFYIKEARSGAEMKLNDGVTILACRDEATRDRVLAFLNGKTK